MTYGNGDAAVYSYDANGNRLSQTVTPAGGSAATTNYSYDNAGQLLSSGAITYTYDANGNLTAAGGNSYSWDYDNRLSSANVGGIASSYGYDAFGVRTTAVISGLNTSYLWDRLAENPLLLDDGSHAYVYADGPLAQFDSSNNRQYLLTDALNSVRGLSDNTGGLVGTVNYDVFGGVRNQSGATSALGFTGELYNPQTQLLHLRARDYAATLGRLLSADTVSPNAEVGQGYNVYAYVANNPTTWVDPSGHQAAGFAPPMDNTQFIEWARNIGDMMRGAVQTFSFSAFGVWALEMGARMGTLATLAGGVTAFNVVVGVLAVAAVLALSYLIWSCLLNQNSWCYKSSTMQGLRDMASDVVDKVAECAIAVPNTTANINMTAMVDVKHHNPCVPEPEEDKEKCDSGAFVAWWDTLAPVKESSHVTDKWWQYEQYAARGGMAYGFTPRRVPTGPINADGIEPSECAFVDAKYSEDANSLKFEFRPKSPPEKLENLIDQLSRYYNAVTTSNGVANAQPRGLIVRTNSLASVPYYQTAMISAGFNLKNSRAEWMPFE